MVGSRASIRDSRKQPVVKFSAEDVKRNTLMVPTNEEINYKVKLYIKLICVCVSLFANTGLGYG